MTHKVTLQCGCGGKMFLVAFADTWVCPACDFRVTDLDAAFGLKHVLNAYAQFERRHRDPMNQLPAHYRRMG